MITEWNYYVKKLLKHGFNIYSKKYYDVIYKDILLYIFHNKYKHLSLQNLEDLTSIERTSIFKSEQRTRNRINYSKEYEDAYLYTYRLIYGE